MKSIRAIGLLIFLLWSVLAVAQQRERDHLKLGYAHLFFGKYDTSTPSVFLEYSRVFFEPFSIGVGLSYSPSMDYVALEAKNSLQTFNLDLNFMYAILNNKINQFQIGLGISARSFQDNWTYLPSNNTEQQNEIRPGVAAVINYHYFAQDWLFGLRGTVQAYGERGSVYGIGGFIGYKF